MSIGSAKCSETLACMLHRIDTKEMEALSEERFSEIVAREVGEEGAKAAYRMMEELAEKEGEAGREGN